MFKTFKENINNESEDELKAEELNKRFNKLKNKKILEAEKLEEKLEILKNKRLVKEKIDALRKKVNDLNKERSNKASSGETSSDSENNGDDRPYKRALENIEKILKEKIKEFQENHEISSDSEENNEIVKIIMKIVKMI